MKMRIGMRIAAACLAAMLAIAPACHGIKAEASAASAERQLKTGVSDIVRGQTDAGDGNKKKLKKLFVYLEKNYTSQNIMMSDYADEWLEERAYGGWQEDLALEMLEKRRGSCFHSAALYAYLAKKATGYPVRVAYGQTDYFNGRLQDHGWAEVKIGKSWYICDPTIDVAKSGGDAKKYGGFFLKKRNQKSIKNMYGGYKNTKYATVIL